jgi:hypothetical protein
MYEAFGKRWKNASKVLGKMIDPYFEECNGVMIHK